MKLEMISERNALFSFDYPEWNLNLHLIMGKKRDFLIDTGMGYENILPILAFRKERKRENELIIVNTHYHFDHIWGNYLFKAHTIIGHELCPKLIDMDWDKARHQYAKFWSDEVEKVPPNLLISGEIYYPEDGVRIFPGAGHSADGLSVFDEIDGVLNVGDNIGDTMDELLPEFECSLVHYIASIKHYLSLDFKKLVSGHNTLCSKEVLYDILALLP